MYSNDQTQIKAGLVNYIGAMISSSKYNDDRAARHDVNALLCEEILNLCKDKDDLYDLFICKPIFRTVINILRQRINCLKDYQQDVLIKEKINSYNLIIDELEKILKIVKL